MNSVFLVSPRTIRKRVYHNIVWGIKSGKVRTYDHLVSLKKLNDVTKKQFNYLVRLLKRSYK